MILETCPSVPSQPAQIVKIPKNLWKRITAFIKRHGGYFNEAEYIREAVRSKLDYDESKERGETREYDLSNASHSTPGRREPPPP